MSGDSGLRDRDVAVPGAGSDALEEGSTGPLANGRRREEDRKPHQILWLKRRREQRHDVRRELVHAVAAPRPCTHEHQSAYEFGTVEGDLLGDESSHRETEEINLLEPESVDEGRGVAPH